MLSLSKLSFFSLIWTFARIIYNVAQYSPKMAKF